MLGKRIDPHDVIGRTKGHVRQTVDGRHDGTCAHGQHNPIGRNLGSVEDHRTVTREPGGMAVDGHVVQRLAVGQSGIGNGVDPAEDAIPDGRPVGLTCRGSESEVVTVAGGQADVSGVDQHLGWDAAAVHAGSAEGPRFCDGHVPVVMLRTDD